MKNPRNVYLSDAVKNGAAKLVKVSGFITHVDTSNPDMVTICFKRDTSDKDSKLIGINAWINEGGPDWHKLLDNAKGRWAVALAVETINHKNGVDYANYALNTIELAPNMNNDN